MLHTRFVLDQFRNILQWLVMLLVFGTFYDLHFDIPLKFVDLLIVSLELLLFFLNRIMLSSGDLHRESAAS
jgi:hypothetical protein